MQMHGLKVICKENNQKLQELAMELGTTKQNVQGWVSSKVKVPQKYVDMLEERYPDLNPEFFTRQVTEEEKLMIKSYFLSYLSDKALNSENLFPKVILQPAAHSGDNMERTIFNPIELEKIKSWISPIHQSRLESLYPDGLMFVWGVEDNNQSKFKRVQPGDVVLFGGADKTVSVSAVVTYKIVNPELSEVLWDENKFKNIYFLKNVQKLDFSFDVVKELIGWTKDYIQVFTVLDIWKSNEILSEFDYMSDSTLSKYTEDIYEEKFKKLLELETVESFQKIAKREEHQLLTDYLFKNNSEMYCAICGKLYPKEFLWVAHIKKRALCSKEEKLDYKNIVMPACKFGCDDLYEKGYIGVEDKKVIQLKQTSNLEVNSYLKGILGNECPYYTDDSKQYFEFHIKRFIK